MSRPERNTYLGGHQVAAIMGVHPFKNELDVYNEIVLGDQQEKNGKMERGLIIEPGFIRHIKEKHGLGNLVEDVFTRHESTPYLCGTADALEITAGGAVVLHEFTVVDSYSLKSWDHRPAEYKHTQAQFYAGNVRAGMIGLHAYVADECRSITHWLDFDPIYYDQMVNRCREFWAYHIEDRKPPFPISNGGDPAASIAKTYPTDNGETVKASQYLRNAAMLYAHARDAAKMADEAKKAAAAGLKYMMADVAKASWDGGYISNKNTKGRAKINWEGLARSMMGNMTSSEIEMLIQTHTETQRGSRQLRVHFQKSDT
ncbi:MAG: hypothetical protein ACPG6R_11050 [Aequoribacter sp.]|uniref:hypothetical protein n=1 Tax=Aequoribacter sp. TaxID=2847771 RepID=UPI003C4015AE